MYVLVTPISELRNEATIITRGRHRDRVGKPAYRHDDFFSPIHPTAMCCCRSDLVVRGRYVATSSCLHL